MKKRRLFRFLFISIGLLLTGFILVKPVFNYISGYLSKSEQVSANILIVEGWLSYQTLESALNEFRKKEYEYIITTGLKSTTAYYVVSMDGYLIFYPKNKLTAFTKPGNHQIAVKAYSELDGVNSAHFNLWINDSLVSDYFAGKHKRNYAVSWEGALSAIDSVMIQFDNDLMGKFGDRNLFVKEIIIDHKIIIPFLNYSVYEISKQDGNQRIINNLSSNAEQTRKRLISMGIDSSKVIAVPGQKARINRTLTSALAVRDWLKTSNIKVKGINILSSGTHARRTWMTFSKVLGNSYKIGIIALPDYKNSSSQERRFLKTFRETAAIIYYWLILIPY